MSMANCGDPNGLPRHSFSPPPPPPPRPPPLLLPPPSAETDCPLLPHRTIGLPYGDQLPLPSLGSVSYPPAATPKPKPRRKPDPANAAAAPRATPPCTECGKRFSSWKALFGHMRCHPERQWRGINPPPHARRPSLLLLPSPSPSTAAAAASARFTDEERDVAASLIMLADGRPHGADAIRSLSWGRVWRHRTGSCKHGRGGGGEAAAGNEGGWGSGGKRRWEESEASGSDHTCNVCRREFSTGQALGGHKRCHWDRGEEHVGDSTSSHAFVLDLNLPPPMEEGCAGSPSPVLDLRLGI